MPLCARCSRSGFVILLLGFTPISRLGAQTLSGCPVFPQNNIWNARVDSLPVHPNSTNYVNRIGPTNRAHADFGSGLWDGGPIGIPYVVVPGSQARVPISFQYSGDSDAGPYPIPPNPPIEGGNQSTGDRHVLVLDQDNCILYEVYAGYPQSNGSWQAGSGAIFDLKANLLRTATWTSADAAGLPILPGLVRYDEVAAGEIRHAIRFTAPQTQKAFIWPARHQASSITDTTYPPMGVRFRLKASVNISGFSADTQVILRAMKAYGLLLADNGSAWYISGVPDERWNNSHLAEFSNLRGTDFEAVDESSLMLDPNSAQVKVAQALAPVAVSPASGSSASQTFTFTFSDPAGWQDLGVVNVLINSALDGGQACYLAYSRTFNVLYLVNDNGSGLLPGMTMNGSGSLGNNQCTVNGAGSSASGSGNTLTLMLNLSFGAGFAGRRVVYMAAGTQSLANSGWHALGAWQVPPSPTASPSVTAANPSRGAGLSQVFSFTFNDNLGWQNLDVVNILINSSLDGNQSCYLAYSRPAGVLYLVNDAGGGLMPGLPLNGSGSVGNHQCTVSGAGSSATGSGNSMTLNLSIAFSGSYLRDTIIYQAARDAQGNNSGWQPTGTWSAQ